MNSSRRIARVRRGLACWATPRGEVATWRSMVTALTVLLFAASGAAPAVAAEEGNTGSPGSPALADGLALTPPMGFNNWNSTHCRAEFNESMVKGIADIFVDKGLKDAGYQYVNLDDCWQAGRSLTGPAKTQAGRGPDGHLIADPQWFPGGMKQLADYLHERNLKLGLYSSHGSATCQNVVGTFGYETVDAKD